MKISRSIVSYNGCDCSRSVDTPIKSRSSDQNPTHEIERSLSSSREEIKSQPFNRDPTVIRWRHRFVKQCIIAIVHRDQLHLIQRLKIKIIFIESVLRDEEQVRDYPSNSPCLENHFACCLFESVLDSFPLQLNA